MGQLLSQSASGLREHPRSRAPAVGQLLLAENRSPLPHALVQRWRNAPGTEGWPGDKQQHWPAWSVGSYMWGTTCVYLSTLARHQRNAPVLGASQGAPEDSIKGPPSRKGLPPGVGEAQGLHMDITFRNTAAAAAAADGAGYIMATCLGFKCWPYFGST